MMRVLLITDNHTASGGAEKYFFELKDRLKSIPTFSVYSLGFGPHEEKGEDYRVFRTTRSKGAKLFWQIFRHPLIYRKLKQEIKRFKPDVIHLHNAKQHSAAILKSIQSYPVVQTIHDYSILCPVAHNIHKNWQPCATGFRRACFWQHQLKFKPLTYLGLVLSFTLLRRRIKKSVKQFLTVSPLLAEYLRKNDFQPVSFIPPFKKEIFPSFSSPPQPGHFLFAGNLDTHKGVFLLIEEFALALKQNSHLFLTIAGSGPEEKTLRALIKQHGLAGHVTFTGWLNDLDLLYQTHFATIVPSLWMEAFGLIITESMNHQRAVIGSNRGSIPWLVDDHHTGLIFDPLKKGDLAEKMLSLAANPELARKLGCHGYAKLQTFIDNEASMRKIVEIYHKKGRN